MCNMLHSCLKGLGCDVGRDVKGGYKTFLFSVCEIVLCFFYTGSMFNVSAVEEG